MSTYLKVVWLRFLAFPFFFVEKLPGKRSVHIHILKLIYSVHERIVHFLCWTLIHTTIQYTYITYKIACDNAWTKCDHFCSLDCQRNSFCYKPICKKPLFGSNIFLTHAFYFIYSFQWFCLMNLPHTIQFSTNLNVQCL